MILDRSRPISDHGLGYPTGLSVPEAFNATLLLNGDKMREGGSI